MNLLRHLLPLCALLVGSVVTVQMLDLVACADELVCADGHQEAGHDAPGDAAAPDCLCHLAFTSAEGQNAIERGGPVLGLRAPRGPDQMQSGVRRRLERPPIG